MSEIVERKGFGHPDTIADKIAEMISVEYSRYCLERYGVILRHMLDKIAVRGGLTKVEFGGGKMIKPIRIYLNGRFTKNFGDEEIPYLHISIKVIREVLTSAMPSLDFEKNVEIINGIHASQGPGVVHTKNGSKNERARFYCTANKNTSGYHANSMKSNDTSTTVSRFKMTDLEKIVVESEKFLTIGKYKDNNIFIGTDIKVMGIRKDKSIQLTLCVPLISKYVCDYRDYAEKLAKIKKDLITFLHTKNSQYSFNISLNTRDSEENDDLYLTLLGSALESGDEGVVGRGNRLNGIIPFNQRISMEASCGKNPVYHIGKIYNATGYLISKKLYEEYNVDATIFLTSQMGRLMSDPWNIDVEIHSGKTITSNIDKTIKLYLENLSDVTKSIVGGEIPFY